MIKIILIIILGIVMVGLVNNINKKVIKKYEESPREFNDLRIAFSIYSTNFPDVSALTNVTSLVSTYSNNFPDVSALTNVTSLANIWHSTPTNFYPCVSNLMPILKTMPTSYEIRWVENNPVQAAYEINILRQKIKDMEDKRE